jgi:hypothetical protein
VEPAHRALPRAGEPAGLTSRSHRYHVPPDAARTIAGLTVLREHVLGPILAGIRTPRRDRKPSTWTAIDRDYEALRQGKQTLLHDLGIAA